MRIDGMALAAILCMALVTYVTRAGGLWLAERVQPSGRMEAGLRCAPGAVLAAIVVPAVLQAGLAGALAVLATVLVAGRTHNLLLAVVAGVGTVWVMRNLP